MLCVDGEDSKAHVQQLVDLRWKCNFSSIQAGAGITSRAHDVSEHASVGRRWDLTTHEKSFGRFDMLEYVVRSQTTSTGSFLHAMI